jgi:TrmH family RNA methyltransferase
MNSKPASKNHIKNRKKLLMGKYRKKEQLFFAEGSRCVEQILVNGAVEVIELLIEDGFGATNLNPSNLPIYSLSSDDFNSLSDTETPQGVIAVCKTPIEAKLDKLVQSEGVIVATDAIQDPGNLGTIIRTASWFGSAGLLIGEGTVDMFHPKVVRSTAGATGLLDYQTGDLSPILSKFEEHGWNILLLDGGENSISIRQTDPGRRTLIVAGNEGRGISENLFSSTRKKVRIDGKSEAVESLNAAVALSIGLFHLQNF